MVSDTQSRVLKVIFTTVKINNVVNEGVDDVNVNVKVTLLKIRWSVVTNRVHYA